MLIAISGLIGAGKSTLCQALQGKHFYEPVDNNPYLADYYQEPARWCFPMQMHLLHERYRMIQAAYYGQFDGKTEHSILDRSIYEDWCFAKLGADAGYMSLREFETYNRAHEDYCNNLIPFPDLLLHIEAPIDTLIEHIRKRDRDCEANVMAEYLLKLQAQYDLILPKLKQKVPVTVLDGTKEPHQVLYAAQHAIFERQKELDGSQVPRYRGGL